MRLSALQAIYQKCLECSGFDPVEVERCKMMNECPLHSFRMNEPEKERDMPTIQPKQALVSNPKNAEPHALDPRTLSLVETGFIRPTGEALEPLFLSDRKEKDK